MRGFMGALDDALAGLSPRRIMEIGVGEGHVMSRVRERFPGVPLVGVDLPDDALGNGWREQDLACMFGDATTLPFPDDSFDLVLAIDHHWAVVLAGVALWGIHMGMTQGLLATMVADAAPADLRGTAYGFFNLMSGLAMLVASALAGVEFLPAIGGAQSPFPSDVLYPGPPSRLAEALTS